ncbi:hypothetical protein [Xanthomonas axonopodis]|uniref:hypothetical protein n=1 Tax=Xanthomonas axonopodis TaxID=53413 RepID=UPI003555BF92
MADLIAHVGKLEKAARNALQELRAIHRLHYPACESGCPTAEAIARLAEALLPFSTDDQEPSA